MLLLCQLLRRRSAAALRFLSAARLAFCCAFHDRFLARFRSRLALTASRGFPEAPAREWSRSPSRTGRPVGPLGAAARRPAGGTFGRHCSELRERYRGTDCCPAGTLRRALGGGLRLTRDQKVSDDHHVQRICESGASRLTAMCLTALIEASQGATHASTEEGSRAPRRRY
jgi:hypothetical protein